MRKRYGKIGAVGRPMHNRSGRHRLGLGRALHDPQFHSVREARAEAFPMSATRSASATKCGTVR